MPPAAGKAPSLESQGAVRCQIGASERVQCDKRALALMLSAYGEGGKLLEVRRYLCQIA